MTDVYDNDDTAPPNNVHRLPVADQHTSSAATDTMTAHADRFAATEDSRLQRFSDRWLNVPATRNVFTSLGSGLWVLVLLYVTLRYAPDNVFADGWLFFLITVAAVVMVVGISAEVAIGMILSRRSRNRWEGQ